MERRVRLKDIAAKTGFSVNTVSVALRGSPRIPEATRGLIRAAASELNYLPNALARSLVKQRSGTVGVVIRDLLNPILILCAQYIEQCLAEHGYETVLAASNNDPDKERKVVETLCARQVEAILVYPTSQSRLDHLIGLRRSGYPIVLLSGAPTSEIDLIGMDSRQGAFNITSHLLALGHRRIAFLDAGRPHGNLEKQAGFDAAHAGFGLEVDAALLFTPRDNSEQSGYDCMGRIMAQTRPTAVFASCDTLAIGALHWCRQHDVEVPGMVSISGYDNIPCSAFLDVPLTTVGYSAQTIGKLAAERVVGLMQADGNLPPASATLLEPSLIQRASCAPPPAVSAAAEKVPQGDARARARARKLPLGA